MNTDTSQILNLIEIKADLSDADSPIDAKRRGPVHFTSGDSVGIVADLLNRGEVADTSMLTRAVLEISDIGPYNAPDPRECKCLISKSVDVADFELSNGSESGDPFARVSFFLDASDTAVPAGQKWLRIVAYSADGSRTTFSRGWIYIDPSYNDDAAAAPNPPELSITRDEALSMFLSRSGNLSDITDPAAARSNIGACSEAECGAKIKNSLALSGRMPRVFFRNSKALVNNMSFLTAFPASFFLRYDIDSFEELFASTEANEVVSFFNTQGVVWSDPFQNCGFRFSYSSKKELTLFCANFDDTPALRKAERRLTIELPTGSHSLGVCAGRGLATGKLEYVCFYLDGVPLGSGKEYYNTLSGNDFSTNTPLTLNSGWGYSREAIENPSIETSYYGFLVTNFAMDETDSPYTPADYAAGVPLPPSILDASSQKRALLYLCEGSDSYQWHDSSGNGNHAIIYGQPLSDRLVEDYCLYCSYEWGESTKASAYVFGDTPVIAPNCMVEVFACCVEGELIISVGESSSAPGGFISSAPVGAAWGKAGEFFSPQEASKFCVTPSVAGMSVRFGVKVKKLVY